MLLYLKIKPNQRFDKVERIDGDWILKIRAPAADGKANQYLVEYLSRLLNIPKSKIVLKKGHTSRIKCLEIDAEEHRVNQLLSDACTS
jgi:uncharacterized protein YggU (UPF0235/DUF167 family)